MMDLPGDFTPRAPLELSISIRPSCRAARIRTFHHLLLKRRHYCKVVEGQVQESPPGDILEVSGFGHHDVERHLRVTSRFSRARLFMP